MGSLPTFYSSVLLVLSMLSAWGVVISLGLAVWFVAGYVALHMLVIAIATTITLIIVTAAYYAVGRVLTFFGVLK